MANPTTRELYVLKQRMLSPPVTYADIGEKLGVTREKVRQIHAIGKRKIGNLDKLRDEWRSRLLQDVSFERSIEVLQLSTRSFNCLCEEGIVALSSLCSMTEVELYKLPNLDKTSMRDIKIALALNGMRLAFGDRRVSEAEALRWWRT